MTEASDPRVFEDARVKARAKVFSVPKPSDESVVKGIEGGLAVRYGGRAGGDRRGSPSLRAERRRLLYAEFWGNVNGYVPCVHCGCRLSLSEGDDYPRFQLDKILSGNEGGTYRLVNLLPSCRFDNNSRARGDHGFGEPEWGDPVANAMRVAAAHNLPYSPPHRWRRRPSA